MPFTSCTKSEQKLDDSVGSAAVLLLLLLLLLKLTFVPKCLIQVTQVSFVNIWYGLNGDSNFDAFRE